MTSGAPWWVVLVGTALGGLLGVFGTIWATAKDNTRARREEWFRRVQWAESLTGTDDPQRRATGFRVLDAIARRDLSSDVAEDRALIDALNRPLDAFETDFAASVDEIEFVEDTGSNDQEEQT